MHFLFALMIWQIVLEAKNRVTILVAMVVPNFNEASGTSPARNTPNEGGDAQVGPAN